LELVKVYREARQGSLGTQEASRLTYILQIIAKVLEQSDLEKRVAALEHPAQKEQPEPLDAEALQRIREDVYGLGPAMKNGKN
jgi:hypothetical protein